MVWGEERRRGRAGQGRGGGGRARGERGRGGREGREGREGEGEGAGEESQYIPYKKSLVVNRRVSYSIVRTKRALL